MLIGAAAWLHALGVDATFRAGGFLEGANLDSVTQWALFALLAGGVGVKAAVMPLHSWLPSAMVAPHAGVRVAARGRRCQGGRLRHGARGGVRVRCGTAGRHGRLAHSRRHVRRDTAHRLHTCAAARQPQTQARVFHHQPPLLHRARCGAHRPACAHRGPASHRGARGHQDHALLRGRRHPRPDTQGERERARWYRAADARHHGVLRPCVAQHGGHPAVHPVHEQVVPRLGRGGRSVSRRSSSSTSSAGCSRRATSSPSSSERSCAPRPTTRGTARPTFAWLRPSR